MTTTTTAQHASECRAILSLAFLVWAVCFESPPAHYLCSTDVCSVLLFRSTSEWESTYPSIDSQATQWVSLSCEMPWHQAVCCAAISRYAVYSNLTDWAHFTALLSQRCWSAGGLQTKRRTYTHIRVRMRTCMYIYAHVRFEYPAGRFAIILDSYYSFVFYLGSHKLSRLCDQRKRC